VTYFSTVLADSPTLLWEFQETSGTLAADATGNGNSGTYSGGYTQAVTGPPGVAPFAVTLNGSTGLIYSAASSTSPNTFSIECWFKTPTLSNIIGSFSASQGSNMVSDREIYLESHGYFGLYVYTGAGHNAIDAAAHNDGAWHHGVGVWNDGVNTHVFIDGAQTGGDSVGATVADHYTGYWLAGMGGGNSTNGGPDFVSTNFAGTLCAWAIYPVALTGTQIANHYAAGQAVPPEAHYLSQYAGIF
jgi:trimeric autotransporter adhesin